MPILDLGMMLTERLPLAVVFDYFSVDFRKLVSLNSGTMHLES